jgi:hypothetical protein
VYEISLLSQSKEKNGNNIPPSLFSPLHTSALQPSCQNSDSRISKAMPPPPQQIDNFDCKPVVLETGGASIIIHNSTNT